MLKRIVLLSILPIIATTTLAEDSYQSRVTRVLKETPLIDGHNDIPFSYRMRVGGHLDEMPFDSDLTQQDKPTHTDLPRLRAGMVGGQFWSVYVPISQYPGAPGDAAKVLQQMDFVYRLASRYPDDLAIALTADDVVRAHATGRIASLIGIEGGHAIENSLGTLRMLYKAGARYMTLTHSKGLRWADSATDEARVDGLSPFGKAVVTEMNRLGMLVDLSHVSPATMHDALDVTRAPVIFSHSSSKAVTDHPRNIPDDVLLRLKENSGVAMVTFFSSYVSASVRDAWADKLNKIKEMESDPNKQMQIFNDWRNKDAPRPSLSDVADHIDHIRELIGAEHIGLGGDYDGMPPGPVGLDDVSTYPALLEELMQRGYSDEEIAGIAGANVLRVMREAEIVAASLAAEPALDVLIDETDDPVASEPAGHQGTSD